MRNDVLVSEEKCFTNKKILLLYLHHVYNKHSNVTLSSVVWNLSANIATCPLKHLC